MSVFVESLRRLFQAGRLTEEKLATLKQENKISEAEYEYIVG